MPDIRPSLREALEKRSAGKPLSDAERDELAGYDRSLDDQVHIRNRASRDIPDARRSAKGHLNAAAGERDFQRERGPSPVATYSAAVEETHMQTAKSERERAGDIAKYGNQGQAIIDRVHSRDVMKDLMGIDVTDEQRAAFKELDDDVRAKKRATRSH